jgi:hypothetical protein
MAQHTSDRGLRPGNLKGGAKMGFVAGAAVVVLGWIAAGVINLLLAGLSVWPNWFPDEIVDLILTDWWMITIIASFTSAGALFGALAPRRYDLL